jgi:phosphatidylserine/phosphatidylglycerophosphate/cardiolipin synthase-like enzyme
MSFKKKIIGLVFAILVLITGTYFFTNTDLSITGMTTVQSVVKDEGNIQVYFCPQQDCANQLAEFIDSAQRTVHCALFELDLPNVQEEILNKQKAGLDVRVITDKDYLYEFNHSFVKVDSWGLMHNKFCIIDGKKVSTGSMNPTINGATKNNNNLLFIESELIARNYEDEFQEMWSGIFKKGDQVLNPAIDLNGIVVKTYFCPEDHCANKVKDELKKAEQSIKFMTFSFTHEGIANIILLKYLDGIIVEGVMEARGVTKYSQFARIAYQDIDVVKDGNKGNMHHKVFIVDEETVITGSFNPTGNGDGSNDENVVIIKSKEIARLFLEEYDYVKNETKE